MLIEIHSSIISSLFKSHMINPPSAERRRYPCDRRTTTSPIIANDRRVLPERRGIRVEEWGLEEIDLTDIFTDHNALSMRYLGNQHMPGFDAGNNPPGAAKIP